MHAPSAAAETAREQTHVTALGRPTPDSPTPLVPSWLLEPDDPNALLAPLWPHTAVKIDGVLTIGGVPITDLVAEYGSPTFILDESDFRNRARAFKQGFTTYDVYYAGKAFLCTSVARWIAEEGLGLDVCSAGELAIAQRSGIDLTHVAYHGNNKSTAELNHAVSVGIGRIIVDSFDEIDRLADITRALNRSVAVMVRVTPGVNAHTHGYIATAHEDQKFGFSLANGDALAAVHAILHIPRLQLLGLHCHVGSQIFDTSGFEVAAHRLVGMHARVLEDFAVELPEMNLGGGFGIAYTSQDTPAQPVDLAQRMSETVVNECRAAGVPTPRLAIEPGRAIVGPAMITAYEVGTVKSVALDEGANRTYVSVDGGITDNIRGALYDADYSCTLASRHSDARVTLSRVVGKHCEAGDIVVKDEFLPSDVRPGDLLAVPGTGAYCRSMASNYNQALRPPVVAVNNGATKQLLRRETLEDLWATDCG